MLLESRRSEYGFFAHDSAGLYSNSEQRQRCMVGSCDSSGSGDGSEPRATRKRLIAQSGSWCRDDLCDVEACRSTETKTTKEKARTFTDIVQDFRFSKGSHVDLRSQHDPPDGTEPRHLSGQIFARTPTEMPGSSSSEMRTERKPVVEPTVIPSATNLENLMLETHDSGGPTPVPGTDETQDRESLDMETDDPDTTVTVSEPPTVVQSVPPPPLPQHRIYGKREAAVVHERSVRPRIELPEEHGLFVHSQL